MANHYTTLTHAYAVTKASSRVHRQVSSIAPPTECLLAITLPSARLSNKGGATTCPQGSIRNVKVHPGSSDPPSNWNTWEEYFKSKPGEFTPDQIVAKIARNRMKIDRTVARILEMFDWSFTPRLIAVISHFERQLGADNPGERWRRALLDFAYCNVGFDLKQLIEVLHCDLQVTIHEGLVEVQDDIFKAIANFIDNFHPIVTTLSAPQMRALLDHMCARCAGSHSFLAVVQCGTTLMRPESFLQNGPTQLLQSFFDWLPDHQTDTERSPTCPTQMEMEVNHFSKVLQTHLVDITSNPALMLDFSCGIDLTKDEAVVRYPPPKGNIADDPEDDLEVPTVLLFL